MKQSNTVSGVNGGATAIRHCPGRAMQTFSITSDVPRMKTPTHARRQLGPREILPNNAAAGRHAQFNAAKNPMPNRETKAV